MYTLQGSLAARRVDPKLVFLLYVALLGLLLGKQLSRDFELGAEVFLGGRESLCQVVVFDAQGSQGFAAGPDVRAKVEVKQQRERFLFLELSIQSSSEVCDFGQHASMRFEEKVRVPAEEVAQIDVCQVAVILLDQLELFSDHVLSVLKHKLRVGIEHLNDLACLDLVVPLQVVEQANHVRGFAAKYSTAIPCL